MEDMDVDAALPDDVLELIFLRLPAEVCLVLAASTCKRWRRVIADAVFLRRFRSTNGPQIVVSYYDQQ
ncbi:hypothetical protein ACP4OV_023805 [Aristida adscensionis]